MNKQVKMIYDFMLNLSLNEKRVYMQYLKKFRPQKYNQYQLDQSLPKITLGIKIAV